MIIAFETENSETLERFKKNFIEPKSMWKQFMHNFAYTHKDLTVIDNTTIIEMESFFDIIGRKTFLIGAIGIIIGYYFNLAIILSLSSILFMFSMFIISKTFRQLIIKIDLKRYGHKPKINFLSYTEIINKLLRKSN